MADKNRYFNGGNAPTAADAPANEFNGFNSQREFEEAYRREMNKVGDLLEQPVRDKVADADRYAHSKDRQR